MSSRVRSRLRSRNPPAVTVALRSVASCDKTCHMAESVTKRDPGPGGAVLGDCLMNGASAGVLVDVRGGKGAASAATRRAASWGGGPPFHRGVANSAVLRRACLTAAVELVGGVRVD